MEQIPSWLNDAVSAAGLATVYVDNFDALIDKGVTLTDTKAEEGPASH